MKIHSGTQFLQEAPPEPDRRGSPSDVVRKPASATGRPRPFAPGVQATLDQFVACIENSDEELRNVALVDFLLATVTLAPEIRRGGTPLGALQLAAMQAAMQVGNGDDKGSRGSGAHFGLAELKALLVTRMGAAHRAQMLAGGDVSCHLPLQDEGVRFALLPLMVLNANRPRPLLHRRIAVDRMALIQAGVERGKAALETQNMQNFHSTAPLTDASEKP